jgi:hypothetical protein
MRRTLPLDARCTKNLLAGFGSRLYRRVLVREVVQAMTNPPNPESLPNWVVEYARASLAIGTSVSGVEQHLVARGLTPEIATAVVTRVLEDRLREQTGPVQQNVRQQRVHRILSAALGCACVLLGYQFGGGLSAWRALLSILLPLACIWFADEIGSNERLSFASTSPTPGIMVRVAGWGLLLVLTLYRLTLVLLIS